MTCSRCDGIEDQFDDRLARRELRRYRHRGPAKTTRMLLDALGRIGVDGASFLDVGGGVGAIQHDLVGGGDASVEARIGTHGLTRTYHATRTMWHVALFTRNETSSDD